MSFAYREPTFRIGLRCRRTAGKAGALTDSTMDRVAPAHADARRVSTTALLAALLASSVLFTVPIHPVPITMQVFVVVLIALLVRPAWAALSVGAYLLLGAAGLPVFAYFHGGLSSLVDPTGGFLFGFLGGAVAGSWLRLTLRRRGASQVAADAAAAVAVIAVVYVLGWAQLAFVAHLAPLQAFLVGVAPFVVIDVAKAVGAVAVAGGVRRAARL
jgi:biotin transport system substrate-specific component